MNVSSPRDNRRRFPRYSCQQPIVVIDQDGEIRELAGECRSVSDGGFGAVISGDLPSGRVVSIQLKPNFTKSTISLAVRVLYRDRGLHGFEFVAPSEKQREAISALFRDVVRGTAGA